MIPDRIIKKIPGKPPPSVREKQGYIEDLHALTRTELLELIDRQDKLIANKAFISKLPDKGNRIVEFRTKLLAELSAKDKVDDACDLLSRLSLSAEELEWKRKNAESEGTSAERPLDSDDESEDEHDPLRIIATHAGTSLYKKQHRVEKPEKSLVRPEDVEDNDLVDKDSSEGELVKYVKVLCDKLEKPNDVVKRERFRPNRTLRKSLDVVSLPKNPHWEVTAATPPLPVHEEAKIVSLHESFHLQKQQAEKLKEVQTRHATERLKALSGMRMGASLLESAVQGAYRQEQRGDSGSSSSDDEGACGEDEDEQRERDTAVMYSLVDA